MWLFLLTLASYSPLWSLAAYPPRAGWRRMARKCACTITMAWPANMAIPLASSDFSPPCTSLAASSCSSACPRWRAESVMSWATWHSQVRLKILFKDVLVPLLICMSVCACSCLGLLVFHCILLLVVPVERSTHASARHWRRQHEDGHCILFLQHL